MTTLSKDQHDNKQKLSELVKQDDFTDKNSISYNAAMYFLLEILEAKITQLGNKRAGAIGILRNGLVHSFMAVNPEDVKSFINAGIEGNQFNLSKIEIEKTDLFKQVKTRSSMPDSIKSDRNDVMPAADKSPFNKVAFEKTKADVTIFRQKEMEKQRVNMNGFYEIKDNSFATYATLYSAGCFCEAAQHIAELIKELGNEIKFNDLKEIRDPLVHADKSNIGKLTEYVRIINEHQNAFETKYNEKKVEESINSQKETKEKKTEGKKEESFVSRFGEKRGVDTIGDILNKGKDGKKQKFSEKEKEKKEKEGEQREGGHD